MLPALRVLSEPPPALNRTASGVQIATPFLGLTAYGEADARLFFGRERDIKACLDRLERGRLVVLVGEHGSGRTSLVRAGIPAAARARLASGSRNELSVLHLDLTVEARAPYDALVEQLGRWQDPPPAPVSVAGEQRAERVSPEQLKELLLGSETGLCEATARIGGGQRTLLVVVDGLEELAPPSASQSAATEGADPNEGPRLLNLLVTAAARRETPLYVVLTSTTEGWLWAQQQVEDRELLGQSAWFLRAPNKSELQQLIVGPAKLSGVEPDMALTRRVVADVRRTRMTLGRLSHALQRTWDAWRKQDPELRSAAPSVRDYEAVGGVEHAFELHAEALFDAQNAAEREATALLLPRLSRSEPRTATLGAGASSSDEPATSNATPQLSELHYDTGLENTLRAAGVANPRETFERTLSVWEELGLVTCHAARQSAAPAAEPASPSAAAASQPSVRVRLNLPAAARAWPRLGLWVNAERAREAQYRRWLRLAECGPSGEPEIVLQGELLREAALFWNRYSHLETERGAAASGEAIPASSDPVGRMIRVSEELAKKHETTENALGRARRDRRHADALALRAVRRRDVSLAGLVVVSVALVLLGASRWRAHVQYDALLQSSEDTSEQKRQLDARHAEAQQLNQQLGGQISLLQAETTQLQSALAASEGQRAEQSQALAALAGEKAELEKNVGVLRRHTLRLDEQLSARSAEVQSLSARNTALTATLGEAEGRAATLAQSHGTLSARLSQCQAERAEAASALQSARSELQTAALQRCAPGSAQTH
jgi:NACHT domain